MHSAQWSGLALEIVCLGRFTAGPVWVLSVPHFNCFPFAPDILMKLPRFQSEGKKGLGVSYSCYPQKSI